MEFFVSALLLAAGKSSRMGRTKQLLQLGSKTVIRHCLDPLFTAGITNITVVINSKGQEISVELRGIPVIIVKNDSLNCEMAESVMTGLRSLGRASSGVLVCLTDHPLVQTATIKKLINEHRLNPDNIVIPAYLGKRGHPTLFPFAIINEIFGGITLRDIIRKDEHRVRILNVDDEGVIIDIDTEEDYRTIVNKIEKKY